MALVGKVGSSLASTPAAVVEDQSGFPTGMGPYFSDMVFVTQPAKWTYSNFVAFDKWGDVVGLDGHASQTGDFKRTLDPPSR